MRRTLIAGMAIAFLAFLISGLVAREIVAPCLKPATLLGRTVPVSRSFGRQILMRHSPKSPAH